MNRYILKTLQVGLVAIASMAAAGQASAAKILVLTTAEGPADGIAIVNNCIAEFAALSPTHTVVTMPGKLNNNVSPLTAQDLSPVTGPYDIVATCTVYASANSTAVSVISAGMQQRAARAFFNFDEHLSFAPAFIAAKNDWSLAIGSVRGGNGVPQLLNTRSIYSGAFSGLPLMGGNSYSTFTGVPINNTLYTPQTDPIPPNSDIVPGASTVVVPTEESYLDGSGVSQGACLFQSTDVSMFDSVRYPGNQGKIATAFINATAPGGACSLSPSISKTFSPTSVVAGGTSTLTIRINNNGGYTDSSGDFQPGAPVSALAVHDYLPMPLQLVSAPTTTCNGGSLAGGLGQNSLALDNATLPSAGCTITATVTWPISAAAECTNTAAVNTINAGSDFTTASGTAQQNATASLACLAVASIQVSKTVAETIVMTGAPAHFTVSVSNIGPVAGSGITISDPMSAAWTSQTWTCSASGGATCPVSSGSGSINVSNLTLPASGALSYAVTSVAAGNSNVASNEVSVMPGDGQCSSGTSSCSAAATVTVTGGVQINKILTSAAFATIGDSVQYMVEVSNPTSLSIQQPIAVSDILPAGLENGTWICNGACGSNMSGLMPLAVILDSLAPHASATFTLSAKVATSANGSIVNTATATTTAPELCVDGQSKCTASADAVQISPMTPGTATPVPLLSQWALMLLSIALAGFGVVSSRRI